MIPVISETWGKIQADAVQRITNMGNVKIAGDGRCDSPGHSAKYSTYSFQNQETCEIVALNITQVTEAGNSNRMEKVGFIKALEDMENRGVILTQITTDRHTQIRKYMTEQRTDIRLQFDLWHVVKGAIKKKLTEAGKKAACREILPWIRSVMNHAWWSSATCEGSTELLVEKLTSVLHHVKGVHSWDGNKLFSKCIHPLLPPERERKKKYLREGSAAYEALQKVILDPELLNDLKYLTKFSHTGSLEVYHALLKKYCPKNRAFSYEGMLARCQLGALDFNAGAGLEQARTKDGKKRYNIAFTKQGKDWVAKPIKAPKNKGYVLDMVNRVVELCATNTELEVPTIPVLPPNIASTPRPYKAVVIAKHRSRFFK